MTNPNPSFGQSVRGYAHYFGTAYSDYVIGNCMTETVVPAILHQDPRYFRRGTGSGWSRPRYAVGQIFRTHTASVAVFAAGATPLPREIILPDASGL